MSYFFFFQIFSSWIIFVSISTNIIALCKAHHSHIVASSQLDGWIVYHCPMQGLSLLTLYDPKHFIRHYLSRILALSQLDCLMRCWNYLVISYQQPRTRFWISIFVNYFGRRKYTRCILFRRENKFHQIIEIKTYNYEMHFLENCQKISNFCPKTNLEP